MRQLKMVVVGDEGVGKTSLIESFTMSPSAGISNYQVMEHEDGQVGLSVWDTVKSEYLRSLAYDRAAVVLLCFSVDDMATFASLVTKWIPEIGRFCIPDVRLLLVGNKIDLQDATTIRKSYSEVHRFSEAHGVEFMRTSTVTGENIEQVFRFAVELALQVEPRLIRMKKSRKAKDLKTNKSSSADIQSALHHNEQVQVAGQMLQVAKAGSEEDFRNIQKQKSGDVVFQLDREPSQVASIDLLILVSFSKLFQRLLSGSLTRSEIGRNRFAGCLVDAIFSKSVRSLRNRHWQQQQQQQQQLTFILSEKKRVSRISQLINLLHGFDSDNDDDTVPCSDSFGQLSEKGRKTMLKTAVRLEIVESTSSTLPSLRKSPLHVWKFCEESAFLFADVEIVCRDDIRMLGHSSILGSRSPVFRETLRAQRTSDGSADQFNDNQLTIYEALSSTRRTVLFEIMTHPSVLRALLFYCYTDLNPCDALAERTEDANSNSTLVLLIELINLANKYELTRLKTMCEIAIAKCIVDLCSQRSRQMEITLPSARWLTSVAKDQKAPQLEAFFSQMEELGYSAISERSLQVNNEDQRRRGRSLSSSSSSQSSSSSSSGGEKKR